MTSRFSVLLELMDPHGRCNRKGLLATVGVISVLELVLGLAVVSGGTPIVVAVKAAMIYVFCAGNAKRLHDLGHSGWWSVGGLAALVLWCMVVTFAILFSHGQQALQPGSFWLGVIGAATVVPGLGMLAWLHLAPGDKTPNRYGPVPQGLGFARYRHDGPALADQTLAVQPISLAA